METCPNCGADIRPTSRFCTACGFRIPERAVGGSAGSDSIGAVPPSSTWGAPPAESPLSASASTPSTAPPDSLPDVVWPSAESTAPAKALNADPEPPSAASPDEPAESALDIPPPAPAYSGPVPDVVAEETINDSAENRVNIALFHIERLQQLVPDITGWSEQQAASVNKAIDALETALKGREDAGDPYLALRETVKTAKRKNRDIDVMVALTDRAAEIEDLLEAHDQYSYGVREALIAIKPAAVNYVVETRKRPARRQTTRRKSTRATTTPAPAIEAPSSQDDEGNTE